MREALAAPTAQSVSTRGDRRVLAGFAAFMAVYYGFLLTGGQFDLLQPVRYGLTFNSMLVHLLNGRFDVDPVVVDTEGFLRNGHVYATGASSAPCCDCRC